MGIPAAISGGIQGAQAINSGVKGKRGANQAQQRQDQMMEGINNIMGSGFDAMEGMQDQANQFLQGGTTGQELMDQAQQGGQQLQNQLTGMAESIQGNVPQMNFGQIAGQGVAGDAASQLQGLGGPQFNFQQGQQTAQQAMQNFDDFAGRARDSALEQGAQQFGAQSDALDAALAGRGMSRDSGVAGGALADLARSQAQQTVGLERDLANMAGEQGLAATQFDVQQGLQRDQMGSQFELGRAGQVANNLQGAGQLGLGMGQNFLTGQGQESQFNLGQAGQIAQNTGLAGELAQNAFSTPLQMQQGMFQENQMQPFLQMQNMANPMQLMGPALSTMLGGQQISAEQNMQGGRGKGAAMGGLASTAADADFSNKSNKNGGGTMAPQIVGSGGSQFGSGTTPQFTR